MGNNVAQYPASRKEKPKQHNRLFNYSDERICYNEQPFRIEGKQLEHILHRSVVALTFLNVHRRINAGSGVLISRDTILTVAHNLFNKELKAENTDFKVYLGADGVAEQYLQVEAWRYPEEFRTCKSSAKLPYDYAIIKLKRPVQFDQFLSLSFACEECLKRDNKEIMLKIFGFPCAYPAEAQGGARPFEDNFKSLDQFGKKIKLYQYGLSRENRIAKVNTAQFMIGYGISTLPGQSGSPVVISNGIIAVHVGGGIDKEFNVGRIVDENLVKNIEEWGKQLSAAQFSLEPSIICKHNLKKTQLLKEQVPIQNSKQQMSKVANRTTELFLVGKNLKRVDLRAQVNLLELYLGDNQLGEIDLSHCPLLKTLILGKNQLETIDLANNRNLTHLYLSYNQLQTINVSFNTNLTRLDLASNRIEQIDLTKSTRLGWLSLQTNRLKHVRLCIAENVKKETYIDFFSFSDQQSAACRVQMMCEGEGQAIKKKAIRVANKWRQQYSEKALNKNNCAFSFVVQ